MAKWNVGSVVATQAYIDKRIQERTQAHIDLVNEQLNTVFVRHQGLRDLVDERANLTDRALAAALAAQQKALDAAADSSSKRFDAVDEWRHLVESMTREAPSRAETDAHWESNAARISRLESRLDKGEGAETGVRNDKEIHARTLTILLSCVAIIITIIIAVVTIWLSTGR